MDTKNLVKSAIKAILVLLAFIAFVIACVTINVKIKGEIPFAVLLRGYFYEITPTKAEYFKANIDVQIEEQGTLTAPLRSGEAVHVTSTTSKAALNLEMVWGGFYQKNAVLQQKPYVAISEKLFAKLFGGFGASEYKMLINESEYNLAGVYRQSQGFLANISGDGIETVYTSRPLSYASAPTQILLYGDESAASLKDALSKEMQTPLNAQMYDMRIARQLSIAIINIMVFFCVCCLLYRALKKAHSIFMYCNSNAQLLNIKSFTLRILQGIIIIASVCIMFWLFLSQISLPPSILPAENLFDMSHYARLLAEFYQSLNSANCYMPLNLAANLLWLQLACACIAVILFCVFFSISERLGLCEIICIKHRR